MRKSTRHETRATKRWVGLLALVAAAGLTGCDAGPQLDTRTFELAYLSAHSAEQLIAPYVFTDRADNPGMLSAMNGGAITVRETPDNLDKIARVIAEYDRPRPMVTLHFQIIEADGASDPEPAISDVEQELRRLFRFEGYRLAAETQVAAIEYSTLRQLIGQTNEPQFLIQGRLSEVRSASENTTVTLEVGLDASGAGTILETSVTIPVGHSVVLGTGKTPNYDGALILVVRAEVVESGM